VNKDLIAPPSKNRSPEEEVVELQKEMFETFGQIVKDNTLSFYYHNLPYITLIALVVEILLVVH
jgi:hypothetical protein